MPDLTTIGLAETDPLVADLQCNTLQGHQEKFTTHLFLALPRVARRVEAVALLRRLATDGTIASLRDQLDRPDPPAAGTPDTRPALVSVMFAQRGLDRLGVEPVEAGTEELFRQGMQPTENALHLAGPDALAVTRKWRRPYRYPDCRGLHLHVLVAHDDADRLAGAVQALLARARQAGCRLVGREAGYRCRRGNFSVEHFGFVDGLSQPRFLQQDIARARARANGAAPQFDPAFPLQNALFAFGPPARRRFGSFFVFRRLEQDVAAFAASTQGEELRAAQLVGRFRDGTPLAVQGAARAAAVPDLNDFNYAADPSGGRCPFHAHVRKANPRDTNARRMVLFPRRGMLFGERTFNDATGEFEGEPPTKGSGVGLLFQAYMGSIEHQYREMQRNWMDAPGFPVPGAGRDSLLAFPPLGAEADRDVPAAWGDDPAAPRASLRLGDFVDVQGGEYFFVPPLSWLRELGPA